MTETLSNSEKTIPKTKFALEEKYQKEHGDDIELIPVH